MRHPYHLVEPSPWPLLISLNILYFLISVVSYFNGYFYSLLNIKLTFCIIISITFFWLYDIIIESLYMGNHSLKVSNGFLIGFILFVITELMLFFSLFWGYFHSALNPTDLIWPPIGINLINPWSLPLLNTFLLLYSGIIATWAHNQYINHNRNKSLISLGIGILLGIIFFILQFIEYLNSTFDITDSVYSSSFFMLTGGHGLHVIIGVSMLIVVCIRIYMYHTPTIFFELAMIYYHFIDLVWILLFILIYYLGY